MKIMEPEMTGKSLCWFVMRDLKRSNARFPAYKMLSEARFEVFTPMKWELKTEKGKKVRRELPFMQDLLFVHTEKGRLDPVVERNATLQYRYMKGGGYREPMTVREDEMERFIRAVKATDNPCYYLPEEITPDKCGREVRIIGGELDGYTGRLLRMRGSRVKRLIVELPGFFAAGVEVRPEYIRFV